MTTPSTLAPAQPAVNETSNLVFASSHIDARWVRNVHNLHIPHGERTIVVNVSTTRAIVAGPGNEAAPEQSWILPWRSTILEDARFVSGESLILLRIVEQTNLAGVILANVPATAETQTTRWPHTSFIFPGYPPETPLWRSPQQEINQVTLDPTAFATQGGETGKTRRFQAKVNLWFAPARTDCGIHNQHTFLEVHTQVHGVGRMQKFRALDAATQYEDVILAPGTTHDPFMAVAPDETFFYPWHRYYSDTDCIWMAIELHPLPCR